MGRLFVALFGAVSLLGFTGCSRGLPPGIPLSGYRLPPEHLEGWRRALVLDFGSPWRREPGTFTAPVGVSYRGSQGGWIGLVRADSTSTTDNAFVSDWVEGENATFILGVAPGPYRVVLVVGSPEGPSGPYSVALNGKVLLKSVTTRPAEFRHLDAPVEIVGNRLSITFTGRDCGWFDLAGLALYRPDSLPPATPSDILEQILPSMSATARPDRPAFSEAEIPERARAALRRDADFLLEWELPETGFSYRGSWYESSFPIRALFGASALFATPVYREAAVRSLDRLVEEQLPDGHWGSRFFGKPGCPLARAQVDSAASQNLADVGSIALCLPVAAGRVDAARGARYLAADRRYADQVVLPHQLESGAFPNLKYEGEVEIHPYSVSTGIQAAHLAALYAATGDARYRTASVRAALFLAGTCNPDGSVTFFPHDDPKTKTLHADRMGDLFYVMEGLLFAYRYAGNGDRVVIGEGLTRFFTGKWGLGGDEARRNHLAVRAEPWEESKRAGSAYLMELYRSSGLPGVDDPLRLRLLSCLVDSSCAEVRGVAFHPAGPGGEFAHAATGWAGLSLLAVLDPGLIFPVPAQ